MTAAAPTPVLARTAFKTSRLSEYLSRKELVNQTGHSIEDWPLVVVKELVDNALDACEKARIAPKISVTVNDSEITVTDNGPGIPAETIDGVLDFASRTSSREAYVAPDRGAQGNALKTVVAIPFVLNPDHGVVEIAANGTLHRITVHVDSIRGEPRIDHVLERSLVKNGTSVTVHWRDSPCSTRDDETDKNCDFLQDTEEDDSILLGAKRRLPQLADDYTFINPHLTLATTWFGETRAVKATHPGWRKWWPSDPTCAHWYGPEHFERLIAGYIAHDSDNGTERTVRQFVSEFHGLTSTGKQSRVLKSTNLHRLNLEALVNGDGLDSAKVGRLLSAMKEHSKPVKPERLGIIGRDQIEARYINEHTAEIELQAREVAANAEVPPGLSSRIAEILENHPTLAWDVAVSRIVTEGEHR